MKGYKLKAIVKRPDEKYGHMTAISDSLENLQRTVDGYIEVVTFPPLMRNEDKFVVICDEEGRLKGKEYNCTVEPRDQRWMSISCDFCGDIIVLGVDGEEFADCPLTMPEWKKMLREVSANA